MKLRNLFLASLIVCTMASCSKDDDGISGPQEVDAYLSFASTTDVMTKASAAGADDAGNGKEAKIQSLTAYVFDEDGKYVISKHVSLPEGATESSEDDFDTKDASITTIKGIHVKVAKPAEGTTTSSTQFKVLLLANMEQLSPADLEALQAEKTVAITTFNEEEVGKSYLPMHSDVLTVTGLKPIEEREDGTKIHHLNWYKNSTSCVVSDTSTDEMHIVDVPSDAGKVLLTRSISRVQFTSLKSNFTGQYANVTFHISSIYLANVRNNATVMGDEDTKAIYFRGGPSEFEVIQRLIDPTAFVEASFAKDYENPLMLNNTSELDTDALGFDKYINANQPKYAEGGYLTRLLITGTLMDGDRELGKKYFHIPLKLVDDTGNVASNKFFKISATITGEGSPNPDEILENACINFSIEVAPWNVVNQTEEDTN